MFNQVRRALKKIEGIPVLANQINQLQNEISDINNQIVSGGSGVKQTEEIGITSENQLKQGLKLGPRIKSPARKMEGKFVDFMARAGHKMKNYGQSPEHIGRIVS